MQKSDHKFVVFVGDVTSHVAQQAQQYHTDAYLVSTKNYKKLLDSTLTKPTVVYTSLGDLPKDHNVFCSILDCADQIIYCPVSQWSDHKQVDLYEPSASMQGLTEIILSAFAQLKNNVVGLDRSGQVNAEFTQLAEHRQCDDRQLWVAGCSVSHGMGVDRTQRFGFLISQKLDMPVSFLTAPGSSIEWAADQICRSDVRPNDVVLWGLTHDARMPWWNRDRNNVHHVALPHVNKSSAVIQVPSIILDGILTSTTQLYRAVVAVHRVINFCKKTQSKLFIAGLCPSEALIAQLEGLENFCAYRKPKYPMVATDLGSDNSHPGPLQHQQIADFCFTQMQQRGLM